MEEEQEQVPFRREATSRAARFRFASPYPSTPSTPYLSTTTIMFCATRILGTRLLSYSGPHLYTLPHRAISSTPPRLASETPLPSPSPELYARLQNTTLAKRLQQSPEALQAIRDFITLLEKEGTSKALLDSSNSILNEIFYC